MATRDPMADLQQMGQQYWQGLQYLSQQFLKQNPAPAAPWADGLEQWRKLYPGGDTAGVLNNLLTQGKSWLGTLEQLFKTGAGGASADLGTLLRQSLEQFRTRQPWLEGMGEYASWFKPEQLQQWIGSLSGTPGSGAHAPSFGLNREQQERLTKLGDDLAHYQRETQRYQSLISKSMEGAIARMERKLAELDEPGRQLKTLKSVYDLWIDALEESYAEVALSPEFREVYGALVNSQMRVRQGIQTQVERSTGELGMPTRSELDGVHRKLADLRRSMRQIDAEQIESLRAEIVELKRAMAELMRLNAKAETIVAKRPVTTSQVGDEASLAMPSAAASVKATTPRKTPAKAAAKSATVTPPRPRKRPTQ